MDGIAKDSEKTAGTEASASAAAAGTAVTAEAPGSPVSVEAAEAPGSTEDGGQLRAHALRVLAIAYLVWHSAGSVLSLYLVVRANLAVAGVTHGLHLPSSVNFFAFSIPAMGAVALLYAVALTVAVVGYAFGLGALFVERTRSFARRVERAGFVLVGCYGVGILWAFLQREPVLLALYLFSAALAATLLWLVHDAYAGDADKRPAPAEPIDPYDPDQLRSVGLLQQARAVVTGYCQLMIAWGFVELVTSLTFLARVAEAWGDAKGDVLGSGIVTGLVLMVAGVYSIACGIANLRGKNNLPMSRFGYSMCVAGVIIGGTLLLLSLVLLALGAPDGVEQAFSGTISVGVMVGGGLHAKERTALLEKGYRAP